MSNTNQPTKLLFNDHIIIIFKKIRDSNVNELEKKNHTQTQYIKANKQKKSLSDRFVVKFEKKKRNFRNSINSL